MENILEIKGITKKYEDFKLDDVSLNIPEGYIVGLIGPNGAGKTTIIRAILNLIVLNSGKINIFGQDHIEYEKAVKDRIGFVFDDPKFYELLSLKDNAKIISRFYSKWDGKLFKKYINDFGLNDRKKFGKLSKGSKMKFAIAVALSHDADLLVLDEPTAGLDPVFRREFLNLLQEIIQNEKKSILLSSHITTDLDKIADYVFYINDGKITLSIGLDELRDKWAMVKAGKELLKYSDLFEGYRENKFGIEALIKDRSKLNGIDVNNMIIENPSIEDMMYLISKGGDNACDD